METFSFNHEGILRRETSITIFLGSHKVRIISQEVPNLTLFVSSPVYELLSCHSRPTSGLHDAVLNQSLAA